MTARAERALNAEFARNVEKARKKPKRYPVSFYDDMMAGLGTLAGAEY